MPTRRNDTGLARATLLTTMLLASPALAGSSPPVDAPEQRILAAASLEAAALVGSADVIVRDARSSEGRVSDQHLGERLKAAWEQYARAWTLVPRSALPPRGICRLAILIGQLGKRTPQQQAAAATACQNALVLGRTAEDMRNRVAAWVAGPTPPSMDDLVAAFSMADGAVRVAPAEPWGYLARTDLALRLDDRALLDAAIADLNRYAPNHETTKRMTTYASQVKTTGKSVVGLAIALLLLGTGFHAASRQWPRRRLRRGAGLAALLFLVVGMSSSPASGTTDGDVPTAEQQLANPLGFAQLLLMLTERAESATARGDHAAAVRAYTDLTKAVPQAAYAYARLCDSLDDLGDREQAIVACRTALTRQGTKEGDHTHFVRLLLTKSGPLTAAERRQIGVVLDHLSKEPRAALTAERVRCNVAVHERDIPALSDCVAKLAAAEPSDGRTISFQWALALETGHAIAAERLLRAATRAGVDADSLGRMREATRALTRKTLARAGRGAALGAGASLVLLVVYVGLRRGRARRNRPTRRHDTTLQRSPSGS
jgi:tetratricopeptide (TPR) repeat protein